MKILLVTHYAPPHKGGIEFVVWEQARRFAALGHEIAWLSSDLPPGNKEAMENNVRLIRHPAGNPLEAYGVPYPIFYPGLSARLKRLVSEADIVHAHGMIYRCTSAVFNWARKLNKPAVLTSHVIDRARGVGNQAKIKHQIIGIGLKLAESWAHRHIGCRNLRLSDRVVVYNDQVRDFVNQVLHNPSRVQFIPNGVDTETFHPVDEEIRLAARKQLGLPADKVIIGFIGRLVPRKGAHLVMEGAPHDAYLLFVGQGQMPKANGRRADQYKHLPAQPREEIPRILHACDILALPSLGEGFPLIAQEAMATGLPVLLANDPGYAQYVNAEVIRLVQPSVGEVGAALESLARNAKLRRGMGEAARRHVAANFSWDVNVRRHLALYEELLSRKQTV